MGVEWGVWIFSKQQSLPLGYEFALQGQKSGLFLLVAVLRAYHHACLTHCKCYEHFFSEWLDEWINFWMGQSEDPPAEREVLEYSERQMDDEKDRSQPLLQKDCGYVSTLFWDSFTFP